MTSSCDIPLVYWREVYLESVEKEIIIYKHNIIYKIHHDIRITSKNILMHKNHHSHTDINTNNHNCNHFKRKNILVYVQAVVKINMQEIHKVHILIRTWNLMLYRLLRSLLVFSNK